MDISTDHSTGTKFGDLQKQERYKRLERDLRLEYFKRVERLKADIKKEQCTSPTWPSVSSINPDNLDSSCAHGLQSLHVSRVESEVIASSTNLHQVFPLPNSSERLPMATSSVKHFPINNYDKDRAIMPPPSTSDFLSAGTKRFSTLDPKQNKQIQDHESSMKISSAASCSSYQEENFNTSHNSAHSRTFHRWKVLLNAQGQLIIKGTLDCGKVARSKPVIHRLSSTTVQSIYKHTYILSGPITDEKEELPDYVRGKFHNGFPDDWENVYQLWTNYVSDGCKGTFRWPTPIADSDDDLYSEITDFSYFKSKQIGYSEEHPKVVANNGSSLGYHSRTQSDSHFNFEKPKENNINNQSYNKIQIAIKSSEDSGHCSVLKDSNVCNNEHEAKNATRDSHNSSGQISNSNLKSTSFLSQIIKEEKLRIIMSNLGNENCPPQYLDKIIELSDCLRYILSYTPDNFYIDTKKPDLSDSKSQVCEKCNNNTVTFIDSSQEDGLLKQKNKSKCIKGDSVNEHVPKVNQMEILPVTEKQSHLNCEAAVANDSSDSDSCMGVPLIPFDRLIQPKSPRSQRYKARRNHNRERNDDRNKYQIETQMPTQTAIDHNDSSVSITEDEFERRKHQMRDHHFKEPLPKHSNDMKLRNEERISVYNEKGKENVNNMNYKSNLPLVSSKPAQNIVDKTKPVIKSSEPAYYKFITAKKVKKSNAAPPDVTILSEDVPINVKDDSNFKQNRNENAVQRQEKLQKDVLKHPFLTYDSEDFLNEKEAQMQIELPPSMSSNKVKDDKNISIEKNKGNSNDLLAKQDHQQKVSTEKCASIEAKKSATSIKSDKRETFGSKNNPKLLTSWVPCMYYDKKIDKLSLTFEGKLLNELGHILHRKFVTDPVFQRHSSTLIETVKHEFFALGGNVSDTKHVVPKELLKQCMTGCPANIQEFCEDWKKLSSVLGERKSQEPDNLHNASIDLFNIPTSKSGRHIVPSLNYWDGERLVKKLNEVVYTPGNTKENALSSRMESTKKTLPSSEKKPQRSTSKKDVNLKGSMSSKPSKTKGSSSDSEPHSPVKKRLIQQLTYSSNEETHKPANKYIKKFRNPPNKIQSHRVTKSRKLDTNHPTRQKDKQEIGESGPGHEKSRRTIKKKLPRSQLRLRSSKRVSPKYEWSYKQEDCCVDALSEDQISVTK